MIKITKIKNGCNCYLVENNDKEGILIDTGLSKGADKILKICKDKKVKLIILTHGHMDHIQGAKKISEELMAPILMHERDFGLISENLSQPINGRTFLGKVIAFVSTLGAKTTKIDAFKVNKPVTGNIIIQECGMEIEIIELPGHTKGSIGVKIEDHFFAGDALMNIAGPGISLLYENLEELMKSGKKISEMGDLEIHFGHGKEVMQN